MLRERLNRDISFMPGSVLLFFNYDYNPIMLAIQLKEQNQKKRSDQNWKCRLTILIAQ
jgi:hypothetical protein